MTPRIDLATLTAATEGASTKGPWEACQGMSGQLVDAPGCGNVVAGGNSRLDPADADHIAAHDPDTCTALHAVPPAAIEALEGLEQIADEGCVDPSPDGDCLSMGLCAPCTAAVAADTLRAALAPFTDTPAESE